MKIVTALAALMLLAAGPASAFEAGRAIPAPATDVAGKEATTAVAILAGGCFWGVQGVFQHTEGVIKAVSGYAGGDKATADYKTVSRGATPHAEAVEITYDPRRISYGRLLQIYFSVAHNPTQLNRQGPDIGPQYRSTIFPVDAEQATVARAYIAQLNQAKAFDRPVVTTIETGKAFFPAEDYHQDYMTLHPTQPYIAFNDLPKIGELKKFFPAAYREKPVLVRGGS
jgi:peptide-methionine (S)-S-oxide reductase